MGGRRDGESAQKHAEDTRVVIQRGSDRERAVVRPIFVRNDSRCLHWPMNDRRRIGFFVSRLSCFLMSRSLTNPSLCKEKLPLETCAYLPPIESSNRELQSGAPIGSSNRELSFKASYDRNIR